MINKPKWHFPPRGWGLDVIQDSSSTHFRDDPIPKLVRETLQNSLDARDPDLHEPVTVEILETYIEPESIDAAGLRSHLQSCLERATEENRKNIREFYLRALETIQQKHIRCLQIIDSGTLGLIRASWDALVFQEGSVEKSGNAPGGSNGVGKNAVLNVSDLRTVFYSTRYATAKEGRVEKLQGKATLMTHPNPRIEDESLQHVGFFCSEKGEAVKTTDIPECFRLNDVGTGVFIMGFNPKSREWTREVTAAIIQNFFHAIHCKKLVAKVGDPRNTTTVINHETLDWLFEREGENTPAVHYYKAIRDIPPETTRPIGRIGQLNTHIYIGSGPRRTAYINRNGMLVTDSREQRQNPIAPRSKSLWPDYCAVVSPDTDRGDEWIRQTENPSHDSMSPRQCFEGKQLTEAELWFKQSRTTISEMIDSAAQIQRYGDTSNLSELATMFPDEFDPEAQGNNMLRTRTTKTRTIVAQQIDPYPEPMPDPEIEPGSGEQSTSGSSQQEGQGKDQGEGPGEGSNGIGTGAGKQPAQPSKTNRRPRIERPRLIATNPTTATLAFTTIGEPPNEVTIRLKPTGSEGGEENPIEIISARVVSPAGQEADLQEGVIRITPQPDERIIIEIETSDILDKTAFRIG